MSRALTCGQEQAHEKRDEGLQADPHGESQGLHSPGGAVAGGLAAAHADGQRSGTGQGGRAAVRHHHGQEVACPVRAGESAPACHDARRVVCRRGGRGRDTSQSTCLEKKHVSGDIFRGRGE